MAGLAIRFQEKIFREYKEGRPFTAGRKYCYLIEYNAMAAVHTWIIRWKNGESGEHAEWVHPLHQSVS